MGCHALLQGIFLTQGSNPHLLCLLHSQASSLPLGNSNSQLVLGFWLDNVYVKFPQFSAWHRLGAQQMLVPSQQAKGELLTMAFSPLAQASTVNVLRRHIEPF